MDGIPEIMSMILSDVGLYCPVVAGSLSPRVIDRMRRRQRGASVIRFHSLAGSFGKLTWKGMEYSLSSSIVRIRHHLGSQSSLVGLATTIL